MSMREMCPRCGGYRVVSGREEGTCDCPRIPIYSAPRAFPRTPWVRMTIYPFAILTMWGALRLCGWTPQWLFVPYAAVVLFPVFLAAMDPQRAVLGWCATLLVLAIALAGAANLDWPLLVAVLCGTVIVGL